jgi:hypothetical protein
MAWRIGGTCAWAGVASKTVSTISLRMLRHLHDPLAQRGCQQIKVFCFFFSKKKKDSSFL